MKKDFIVIMVMCRSSGQADRMSKFLLKERLVACVNILPGVRSQFWWKGKLNKASETLLIMKTKRCNFKKISSKVGSIHSYEVPEIIALPIINANSCYLDWISQVVV